jgi:BlaR1 peptidase M56/Surface antigen variable number repeat
MERLFLEFAVRTVLLVGGTAIVLYITRVKAAAAKHSVWTGVVALMLVLPIWTAWGPKASLRLLPPMAQVTASGSIVPVGSVPTVPPSSPLFSTGQAVLLSVYLLGLCLLLFRLAIGTVRARRLARDAVFHGSVRTSPSCAAPVTVGFFHPVVILPEHWRHWQQAQLEAVLTHESEHARRRDSFVQWLALLNRALFWFHPAAWWLERTLSALAEEACDNVVLARGHNPREYAECLIDIARSVARSGARLNIAGMTMPGRLLPQRIRRIMEGHATHISRPQMACVAVLCAITCTAFATGTLDHARQSSSWEITVQRGTESAAHPGKGFVLGDLKIEGDVQDPEGVRGRILKVWKDQEFGDTKELVDAVTDGIRKDFQERGYFKVVVHDPASQLLGLSDGKQHILITAPITEGDQFRLGTFTIQNVPRDRALSISAATLRDQFHIGSGELFNVTEIRAGMGRVKRLYEAHGYLSAEVEPDFEIDNVSHRVDLILRITEGTHK